MSQQKTPKLTTSVNPPERRSLDPNNKASGLAKDYYNAIGGVSNTLNKHQQQHSMKASYFKKTTVSSRTAVRRNPQYNGIVGGISAEDVPYPPNTSSHANQNQSLSLSRNKSQMRTVCAAAAGSKDPLAI